MMVWSAVHRLATAGEISQSCPVSLKSREQKSQAAQCTAAQHSGGTVPLTFDLNATLHLSAQFILLMSTSVTGIERNGLREQVEAECSFMSQVVFQWII